MALLAGPLLAQEAIIVQSTTSTENSGLYEAILPEFEAATGIEVRVVAVGTGQALRNAQNCDGDMLVVHAKPAEEDFVAAGYGLARHDLMYNDFVLVGPAADPAGVAKAESASAALDRIANAAFPFTSRGDRSGTHQAELRLWEAAGVDAVAASGTWYLETGSGMGATLNAAVALGAYALTDRGTWIAFQNKGGAAVLYEGDPALFNQYGVIVVSPEHCPNTALSEAEAFRDWLLGAEGQAAIAAFEIAGTQLFFPNAE